MSVTKSMLKLINLMQNYANIYLPTVITNAMWGSS